jgi:predicted PurR-regulated permease PerM
MNRLRLEITWSSLWRIVAMVALIALLYTIKETIIVLLLAILISSALEPVVERLVKWHIPRILGTVSIFLIALALLALLIYTIVPLAILEFRGLFNNLSGIVGQLFGLAVPETVVNAIVPRLDNIANLLLSGNASFIDVVSRILGGITFFLTTLVLSLYLTATRDGVGKFLRAILPDNLEDSVLAIYYRSKRQVGRWMQGQIVLCILIAVAVFLGLWFLGVKYTLVLAILAGTFEIVPLIGPIFAGALSVAVALGDSSGLAISTLIFFVVIHQIENHVLVPLVMRGAVDVHPAVVIVALLGGYQLAGIPGMLLAVPAAVVFQEVINSWVAKKARDHGVLEI